METGTIEWILFHAFLHTFPIASRDACRNLRNNRSEISRNIGREVYSSKLLEIVSTFLSRGFHSLKLGFLLSKEIFFTDPCFRGAVKKGKEKKMINSLPSFSRFPWHFQCLLVSSFTSRFLIFFFVLSLPFPGFSRCFLNIESLYIRAEKQTRVTKVEIRTIDTEKKGTKLVHFFPFFFFFFFLHEWRRLKSVPLGGSPNFFRKSRDPFVVNQTRP